MLRMLRHVLASFSFQNELRALRNAQLMGQEEFSVQQRLNIAKFLEKAVQQEEFNKNAGNFTFNSLELAQYPILDRKACAESGRRFLSAGYDSASFTVTGGSTGEPVTIYHDKVYLAWNRAAKVFFDSWAGYQPGEPKVILWGARRDTLSPNLASRLARVVRNETWFDAYDINEERVRAFFQLLERKQPKLLLAYAESLDEMVCQAMALDIPAPRVGAIMTSAGTLYPDMRKRIESYFQVRIFDRYGAREVGDMACECSAHEGLHVNPMTHHVELIKEDGAPAGPGESGEVVVTLLTNYAMPLIRYRIGDVATWAERPCSCGLPWPLLKRVEGRVTDHFVLPDGNLLHGGRLRTLLFDTDAVVKYQWVQYKRDHVVLYAIPNPAYRSLEAELACIIHEASRILGPDVKVDLVPKQSIESGPTGKHRFTISHVQRN